MGVDPETRKKAMDAHAKPPPSNSKLMPKGSVKWWILHGAVKTVAPAALGHLAAMTKPIIDDKQKNGWINPEVEIVYEIFTELMARDEPIRKEGDDYLRNLFTYFRDVVCVFADEDSHYLLRMFYLIELLHERYPDFRIEWHKNKAYWDWEQLYAGLRREREKEINDGNRNKLD